MANRQEWVIEHDIFHKLVRRFKLPHLEHVYLAIQAGLTFGQKTIDVGAIIGRMLPEGRMTADIYCPPIGANGLAFFYFLFTVERISEGRSDYHTYKFTRRYDNASIEVKLKTDSNPHGADFINEYTIWLKKLDKARDAIIEKNNWKPISKIIRQALGDDTTIIDLENE